MIELDHMSTLPPEHADKILTPQLEKLNLEYPNT